jgi:hypothetical protein
MNSPVRSILMLAFLLVAPWCIFSVGAFAGEKDLLGLSRKLQNVPYEVEYEVRFKDQKEAASAGIQGKLANMQAAVYPLELIRPDPMRFRYAQTGEGEFLLVYYAVAWDADKSEFADKLREFRLFFDGKTSWRLACPTRIDKTHYYEAELFSYPGDIRNSVWIMQVPTAFLFPVLCGVQTTTDYPVVKADSGFWIHDVASEVPKGLDRSARFSITRGENPIVSASVKQEINADDVLTTAVLVSGSQTIRHRYRDWKDSDPLSIPGFLIRDTCNSGGHIIRSEVVTVKSFRLLSPEQAKETVLLDLPDPPHTYFVAPTMQTKITPKVSDPIRIGGPVPASPESPAQPE